ncbi:AEC family transporter [Phormidesmis priestleyi ULC007]|uniref:AEC family transporter n=1 Tax=Phormidesmis priestleyi ULC007 TaxID=1920490 RepID=A0A2T1DCB5_9CYAN|nr:AEC family transporter [Phormidesmis priestleyi]PSB18106.1 AEC family transporter [Phormidesmis priestleyi ULC007]PZO49624.1 MAG: AEC family transporter [Phormidesmis priestleyi]
MVETLLHAYTPLIFWTGLGILSFRFVPQTLPHLLGRSLYWVGVPWQIFALARQTDFSHQAGLAPAVTLATLGTGLILAWSALQALSFWLKQDGFQEHENQGKQLRSWLPPLDRPQQGTFVIASMLGNTGFVGLGIIPALLNAGDMSWAIFFSVTQNLVGTYGIGVLIASYYGRSAQPNHWWLLLRDVLLVPSLWAFTIGYLTQSIPFPDLAELAIDSSLLFVIPASFLLMGMRLSQLQGWRSLRTALIPVTLKIMVLPSLVALGTTLLGLSGDSRLSLVLMAGMPSAFASLILSEEYNLDRDLASSSIALSTIGLLLVIPLWLSLFGG